MATVSIGLPPAFTSVQQQTELACEAATVGQALRRLAAEHPQYEARIFYGERLLVVVTLNGRHLVPSDVLGTTLADGDRIDLLLPVAGG